MPKPFFSIIITVLNGGKTIKDCLASIMCQTFSDYELIIVDGGSTDNTLEEIENVKIGNKLLYIIPNIGLYAGLNAGIKYSSGQWLYFIGADDALFECNTLEIVYGNIAKSSDCSDIFVGSVACIKQNTLLQPLLGSPYLMRHQVHHQGMFYNKNIFDNNFYNEDMRIASDYEFNLRLSINKFSHSIIDTIVCNFGGDGISESQIVNGFKEMQQVHKSVLNYPFSLLSMGYFWTRRKVAKYLRDHNMVTISTLLRRISG